MSGSWSTTYQIAVYRNETNEGEGSMSEHAVEVLQNFAMKEQAAAMKDFLGGVYGRFWG
jgi:hypothetical protein